MTEEKNLGGRPTKYNPDYHPKKVIGYCLLGLTDEQIAGIFEIAVSTLYEWKKEFPEFSEAIKNGKEEADVKIAASLYKRATGHKEKKTIPIKLKETKNGEGSTERVELVEVEDYYPPEVSAQIFWLKNRNPQMWRDKKEVEVQGGEVTGFTLSDDEEE